jgi:hypothetical protein
MFIMSWFFNKQDGMVYSGFDFAQMTCFTRQARKAMSASSGALHNIIADFNFHNATAFGFALS